MKKAFAWLESNHVQYTLHDYKKLGAPVERLKAWSKQIGWQPLLNTKSATFKQLPPGRQQGLNAASALALMQEAPSMIRRPIIEGGKKLLLGFVPDEYEAALK
jgi:arsenate reductase